MNQLDALADRRPSNGLWVPDLIHGEQEYAICFTHRTYHPLRDNNALADYQGFCEKHSLDHGCKAHRIGQDQLKRTLDKEHRRRRRKHLSRRFVPNANVNEAFRSSTSLDLTSIGIASSVTAGWCSCWIDNSSNLDLDVLVWYYSQAVNTAASSQKEHVIYGPGSFLSTDLPVNTAGNTATNSSSASATLTFLDYTANDNGWPIVKRFPYITTNKPIGGTGLFGFAKAHDGVCPQFVWVGLINAAGPTIGTGGSPATAIKYRGVYLTVV
jgi:hypothetical protein